MQSQEVRFSMEDYYKRKEEDDKKYALVKKMLQETQESTQRTLQSLDGSLANLQQSIISAQQTQAKIDDFKRRKRFVKTLEFSEALGNIVTQMAQAMGSGFKHHEGWQGPVAKKSTIEEVIQVILNSKNVVFLTGAGLSAASGVPTFRGSGGFWTSNGDTYEAQKVLTHEFYKTKPDLCWKWHQEFQAIVKDKKPNQNHEAIAKLHQFFVKNKTGKTFNLVTQNIDGYHVKAYSDANYRAMGFNELVYEIHGNINYMRCANFCYGNDITYAELQQMPDLNQINQPICGKCGGAARPHILFFDEQYDEPHYRANSVRKITDDADCLVVIGTKLETGLSASIVTKAIQRGIKIIEINPEPCIEIGEVFVIDQFAEKVVPKVCESLIQKLSQGELKKTENTQIQKTQVQTNKKNQPMVNNRKSSVSSVSTQASQPKPPAKTLQRNNTKHQVKQITTKK